MTQKLIKASAPAKINLALHVTSQREDGFHVLDSLVVFTDFGDEIYVGPSSKKDQLTINGDFAKGLDNGTANLVSKAVMLFKKTYSISQDFQSNLTKNLPIASGMGGGSADTAAALIALAKITNELNMSNLIEMAKQLGADVPMCVHSQTLIARGIGEEIELIEGFPSFDILLVNPMVGVSTPDIFNRLADKNNDALAPLPKEMTQATILDWLQNQRNDLQAPAVDCEPIIAKAFNELKNSGAELVRMSGSGATCFGLFYSKEECEHARLQITKNHPNWWARATRTKEFGIDRAQEMKDELK